MLKSKHQWNKWDISNKFFIDMKGFNQMLTIRATRQTYNNSNSLSKIKTTDVIFQELRWITQYKFCIRFCWFLRAYKTVTFFFFLFNWKDSVFAHPYILHANIAYNVKHTLLAYECVRFRADKTHGEYTVHFYLKAYRNKSKVLCLHI